MATDERIERGVEALLELRRERLAAGERPLGWKVGFGSPPALERLGTTAPLVGFMTDRSLVAPAAEVSLDGWRQPMLEPEIALYLDGRGGFTQVGLAFELADLQPELSDPEAILRTNIFHRSVVLGPERGASADGLVAHLYKNGELVETADDVERLTGKHAALAQLVSDWVGDLVRPGDVLIAGSITAPLPIAAGDRIRYELEPLGSLELSLAPSASSVSS